MWKINEENLHYYEHKGPCSYVLREWVDGHPYEILFPIGGIDDPQVSMDKALGNLLDNIENGMELLSPSDSAVESELWADKILGQHS